jgi:hypothetical protein
MLPAPRRAPSTQRRAVACARLPTLAFARATQPAARRPHAESPAAAIQAERGLAAGLSRLEVR